RHGQCRRGPIQSGGGRRWAARAAAARGAGPQRTAHQGAAGRAFQRRYRRDRRRQRRQGVATRHGRACHRRRRRAVARGPSRRGGPCRTAAGGDRGRLRRRRGRRRRARHGRGGRGASGGAGARSWVDGGAAPGGGTVAAQDAGPVPMTGDSRTYVALSGGIGGAKLALGLARLLGERLTVIVNTGDDFEHLGLAISRDVDTTLYTLAGVANPETGWGRRDETWSFMKAVAELGGPTWFKLGDRDLAIH